MRNIIAVVLGAAVAFGLVTISDAAAGRLFQLPAAATPAIDGAVTKADTVAMKAALESAIANAPLSAVLMMVLGYGVAAFGGAFIARKIAMPTSTRPPLVVGMLVLAATVANFTFLRHPTLMVVLGVLTPIPGAMLGARAARVATPT